MSRRQRMWRFLAYRWQATVAYLILVVGVLAAIAQGQVEDNRRVHDVAVITEQRDADLVEQQRSACNSRNATNGVLLQLVKSANDSGSRIDLTTVPGFTELDTRTQRYLTNLNEQLNAPRVPSVTDGRDVDGDGDVDFVDRALEIITFENCSQIGKN